MNTENKISSFRGKYAFLSNSYPCIVEYEGFVYPSVEHAYQAAKSLDGEVRKGFQVCPTAKDAKAFGAELKLRPDWKSIKQDVLKSLILDKFSRNLATEDIRELLLSTGDAYIDYDRDNLGHILMEVRSLLREESK